MALSKMSSSEGLLTHRDNKPNDSDDTDKDADSDLELEVELPVAKKRAKKSYIFYKFIENIDIDQTNLDIQRAQYSPNSLWRRRKCNNF